MVQFISKQTLFVAQLFSRQGQGHEPLKVGNSSIFNSFSKSISIIYNRSWQLIK